MPEYRRAFAPGGTFFFAVVTERRAPILSQDLSRAILRQAIEDCRKDLPFDMPAFVLLPDHVHAIWTLPDNDSNFSTRWSIIKRFFSQRYLSQGGIEQPQSDSRRRHRRLGVWQRRFWEHLIRDQDDFNEHLDYVHYNPVKHGLVRCPHAWPYSSFHRCVKEGLYEPNWMCICNGRTVQPPKFDRLDKRME